MSSHRQARESERRFPRVSRAVHPQVGAVLQLNTALVTPSKDDTIDNTHCLRGHKHWLLDGSCVLLGNDSVLAIRHTVLKRGCKAAFFPYEGFFLLESSEQDYSYGDSVVLISLQRSLRSTAPFPYAYGSKTDVHRAVVAGYGRWKEPAPVVEKDGWRLERTHVHRDGIQRQAIVKLGMPSDGPHYDNLDLNWWSPYNGRLVAHVNNSGGPLLWQEGPDAGSPIHLVGITRETKGNQQSCSRITHDRFDWLKEQLSKNRGQEWRATERLAPIHESIDKERGWSKPLEVPKGRWKTIAVTLSATDGLRLQMGLLGESHQDLKAVAADDDASGRFLYREWPLPKDAKEVTIGVAPVMKSLKGDGDPESVEAQICCGFY